MNRNTRSGLSWHRGCGRHPLVMYEDCRIDVPNQHMAVLTHKLDKTWSRGHHGALDRYKGVQKEVLRKAGTTTIPTIGIGTSCRRSKSPKANWACEFACTAKTSPPGN